MMPGRCLKCTDYPVSPGNKKYHDIMNKRRYIAPVVECCTVLVEQMANTSPTIGHIDSGYDEEEEENLSKLRYYAATNDAETFGDLWSDN